MAGYCECGNELGVSQNVGRFVTLCEPVSSPRVAVFDGVSEWMSELTDNLGQGWP